MSETTAVCPKCRAPVSCLEDGSPPRFCTLCNTRMSGPPDAPAPAVPSAAPAEGGATPADADAVRLAAALAQAAAAATGRPADPTPGPRPIRVYAGPGPAPDTAPTSAEPPEGLQPIPGDLARRLGIAEEAAAARAPDAPVIPVRSYCDDLEVRFNRARVFIERAMLHFELEFLFLADGMSDLTLDLAVEGSVGDDLRTIAKKKCTIVPQQGVRWPCMLNFQPDFFGSPAITLHVGYRRGGETRRFEAQFPCQIYPRTAKARDVIEQQVTNLTIEVTADRGGIADFSNALNYLGQLKKDVGAEESLDKMLDRIEQIPRAMTPLELFPSRRVAEDEEGLPPMPPMPPAAAAEALTLEIAGWKAHLLSQPRLQMGRHKSCGIMTRLFEPDGSATKERNVAIGRFHARLELHGDRCFLFDRGPDPETGVDQPSKTGTYLNQNRVAPGHSAELPLGMKSRIALGGRGGGGPNVFELDVHPWTCGLLAGGDCPMESRCLLGTPACVFIRRADAVREVFAVVWKCCPLSVAVPEAGALYVWRQGGGFAYRLGKRRGWLVPGQAVTGGDGRAIAVGPYRQFGK